MRQVITLKNTPDAPLSEQAIADATLAFANGADLHIEGQRPKPSEVLELERQIVKGWLERIKKGESAALARELLAAGFETAARGPRVERKLTLTSDGLSVSYFETLTTGYALAKRGIVLVLSSRELREKLCQCRYSKCGNLFWKIQPPKGPPQRFYCCEDHMKKGHSETVAKVARERRRNKALRRRGA